MLYFVFRFVLIFIITLVIIILMNLYKRKKCKINKLVVPIKIIVVAVICFYFALCIPFENLYISFDTPSDAYKYQNLGSVLFTIENENNALIVIRNGSKTSCDLYYKQDDGWKLNWPYSFEQNDSVISDSNSGAIFFIVRYKVNNGNYNHILVIWSPFQNDSELELSDNINSNFEEVYADDSTRYLHCYVKNIDENYRVFINGEAYSIE